MKEFMITFLFFFSVIAFATLVMYLIAHLFITGHPVWGGICTIIAVSAFFSTIAMDCEEEIIDEEEV